MGMASTNIENDPGEARIGSPAAGSPMQERERIGGAGPKGALSELGTGGAGDLPSVLTKQIKGLEETRSKKKAVIDEAIKNLSSRAAPSGPSAEELFRLMGAFAAPTKTGNFFESLSGVGNTAADILGKRRESATGLSDLMTKYKLQGLDVDADHLKEVVDATKTLQAANSPVSVYGKTAQDEGLKPGTPAFAARVQDLAAADLANKTAKAQGPQLGAFDTKTGNYVAGNGTVIKANEIKEDRENRDAIVKLQDAVKQITPDVAKRAEGWDWTTGDTSKFIAGKFMPKQLSAQVKINASALQERLKNLPPGPASDNDIKQAKSSFPGFADAGALNEWVKTTNSALDNYLKRQNEKYGDVQWYGAGKTPGAPSEPGAKPPAETKPNSSGVKPDDKGSTKAAPAKEGVGRPNAQAVPSTGSSQPVGAPKVGAIYKGHEFLGGDPKDKASWKKVNQ